MIKVEFHDLDSLSDDKIIFVVIGARYCGKWVLVRHKERTTWEIPGGHRELCEDLSKAASRELFEETGAYNQHVLPVCIYSVTDGKNTSYGQLYYCEITELGKIPVYEIDEIQLLYKLPSNLTYPLIQPSLIQRVEYFLNQKNSQFALNFMDTKKIVPCYRQPTATGQKYQRGEKVQIREEGKNDESLFIKWKSKS